MNVYPKHYSFSQKLDLELAKRSRRSAILYFAVSTLCFIAFLRSNTLFDEILVVIFFVVAGVSVLRWIVAHRICLSEKYADSWNRWHKQLIFLTMPFWSLALFLIFYQSRMQGIEAFFALLLACAFSAGSIISLSPARTLNIVFPTMLLLPMAVLAYRFADSKEVAINLAVPSFILLCLVYCFIQSNDTRRDLYASIQFETWLIKSNEDLIESQRRLQEETAIATHSSRLAALGEMAGGIAHEINNPLMIIKSHALIMQKSLIASAPPIDHNALDSRLEKIVSAVQRVANIVKGLRSFAQQGDLLPLEKVPLADILQDTLDFCHEKLTQHSVKIYTESLEKSEIQVLCRSVQISQVFLNLINNSFDATKNLDDRWIRINVEAREGHVFIYFQDSGFGIQSSSQEKIFQPFYTTKETGEGTGLGLSISRGILKAHQGEIQYLPAEKHTTFVIKLPIATNLEEKLL